MHEFLNVVAQEVLIREKRLVQEGVDVAVRFVQANLEHFGAILFFIFLMFQFFFFKE